MPSWCSSFCQLQFTKSTCVLSARCTMAESIVLYPLSNYAMSVIDTQHEEDSSVAGRLQRLQNNYEDFGMRRSVEGVILVHEHGHPHVLVLLIAGAFHKLPGHYLAPGEPDEDGLKRLLDEQLGPDAGDQIVAEHGAGDDWEVGDCLSMWYRPAFEPMMYPYCPAHITKPKEVKKMMLVRLPERKVIAVPVNMKLIAVPLCDLYENPGKYGQQIAAIPHMLSRYNFIYV